jgi:hypothetical protein
VVDSVCVVVLVVVMAILLKLKSLTRKLINDGRVDISINDMIPDFSG